MKNTGSTNEVIHAFLNGESGPWRNGRTTVFYEHNVLYSYGYHFPLAVKYYDCCQHKQIFIVNGDSYSNTTSKHQTILQGQIYELYYFTTSFSALRQAMDTMGYTGLIDKIEKDLYVTDIAKDQTGTNKPVPTGATAHYGKYGLVSWHKPGGIVFQHNDRSFLAGMDDNQYFISELPRRVETINEAFETLKPIAVKQVEEAGIIVRRQGEWFFIPHIIGADAKFYYKNMEQKASLPNIDGGNDHISTRLMNTGKYILVSGRISHPQHKTLVLSESKKPIIFEAHKNTAINNWSVSGVD